MGLVCPQWGQAIATMPTRYPAGGEIGSQISHRENNVTVQSDKK
jgi:hypothetical protein